MSTATAAGQVAPPRHYLRRALPCLVAALGSLVLAAWLYRWWQVPLGIPFSYDGDALTNGMAFKAVLENGSIWNNDRLAAPFGQHFQDWPLTDLLPLYFGAAFAAVTGSDWPVAMNFFYVTTFPAIAVASWWAMRKMGVQRWIACALSVIYALAPYHFARGADHIFLAGYFGVPLGVWLANSLFEGGPFTRRATGGKALRYLTWANLRTVALAILITSTSIYYAAFTGLLISIVVAAQLLRRQWTVLLPAASILGVMAVTFMALAAPTFAYRADYGPNVLGAQRVASDTELYGLKLAQMVLPNHGHRFDPFEELRLEYVRAFPVPAEQASTALGLVATAGLALLLLIALVTMMGSSIGRFREQQRRLSLMTLALFLIATVGGIATLISLFLTAQIRGWNRISIVIAFLALTSVGLLLTQLKARFPMVRRTGVAVASLITLVLFAALDQFPPYAASASASGAAAYNTDAEFLNRVEATLPDGSAVFQLPVQPFPEPLDIKADMKNYDPMKPYLHTEDLRWSYAGIEGRVEYDWQYRLNPSDHNAFLRSLVAADFDGLYIDRFAYEDRAAPLEAAITALTGVTAMESRDDRLSFFDLRSYGDALRANDPAALAQLREELLFPVITQISSREYRNSLDENGELSSWAPEDVTVPVVNESDQALTSEIDFTIETGNGKAARYAITWPDGQRQVLFGGAEPLEVSRTLLVQPGRSDIFIDSDTEPINPPDDFRVLNFTITDIDVQPAD